MIKISATGSFKNLEKTLAKADKLKVDTILRKYGEKGVKALSNATPKNSGKTANSWNYKIKQKNGVYELMWNNSSLTSNGIPIVILLQYGHASRGGSFVVGRDFINPSMKPIFDDMAKNIWREVTGK